VTVCEIEELLDEVWNEQISEFADNMTEARQLAVTLTSQFINRVKSKLTSDNNVPEISYDKDDEDKEQMTIEEWLEENIS